MNKKGFTLIELLATIVIMALILLMVMPSITALQESNKERPFEYYGSSLIEAAKLYVDKEGEDITSLGLSDWAGCVDISYEDLINSKLIQPYEDKEYNCSINTKVRYTKDRSGNDSYEYNMTCRDNSGKVVFEHIGIDDSGVCNIIDTSDTILPTCGDTIGESTEWTKENRTITINCSDENGCPSVTKTFTKDTKVGYITITDGKGNKKNCPVNVYVDKTPPTYEARYLSNFYLPNSTVPSNRVLQIKVTDSASGLKNAIYTIPFSANGTYQITYNNTSSIENYSLTSTNNGSFSITITDNVSNTTTISENYHDLQTTPLTTYR